ncbi:MAG TPA: amidase [Gemmatimonadaceae bacterium]|nr:amidase [Gemmatimonadaceae bacterium]
MTIPDDVLYRSVRELSEGIRARTISPVELAEAYLQRLEQLGPRLGAVVTITRDRALREARAAERDIAGGQWRGPLHGIPYGVKDLLATTGDLTTWGAAPYRDQRFDFDATVVQRLTRAGAVLVAKLAMIELAGGFGYRQADASFTGPARTPWNLRYWAGGSSSGPGAAVSAALVPFAIGSETWGSITTPSAFSGVTGLRPTYGRVSRYGAMALSWSMDKLGPMCRTADDCGIVLAAIAGADTHDPSASSREFAYAPEAARRRRMRIGVLKNATAGVQKEVADNFEASLRIVADFAELIPDVELPDHPYGTAASLIIDAEGASAFEDLLETGRAKLLSAPEDRHGGYSGTAVFAKDYIKALRLRGTMGRALDEVFARYDAVVSPTRGTVAFPIGKPFNEGWPSVPVPPGIRTQPLGAAANIAGLPGIAVPNGFGLEQLPTSLTFTGRAFEENLLIAAASEYQTRTDWHRRRPPIA